MGDQLISYHKEKRTPERFPDQASPRKKHSPEKKAPIEMFINRYNEYVKHIDKVIPSLFFENLKESRPETRTLHPSKLIKSCTALKLSTILLEISSNESLTADLNAEEAVHYCIKRAEEAGILKHIDDIETLMIYIQQMDTILRESGINEFHGDSHDSSRSYGSKYIKLFKAFWNKVRWEEIFLSMPDFAAGLQRKKGEMTEIMLQKNGSFRLDAATNEFLKSTGLGRENDIYLISFLDFYFFTWLSHFGLINYLDGNDNDPVMIEVTEYGKKILQLF